MIFKKSYVTASILFIGTVSLKAQDRIYYTDGKIVERKITEISGDDIKASVLNNIDVSFSTKRSDVLFVFNRFGDFLAIPKLKETPSAQQLIEHFLNSKQEINSSTDRIITIQDKVIACTLNSENEDYFMISVDGQEEKILVAEVALIIYKNGSHKIYADIKKVTEVLGAVQDNFNPRTYSNIINANATDINNSATPISSQPLQNLDTIFIQPSTVTLDSNRIAINISNNRNNVTDNETIHPINNLQQLSEMNLPTYNEYARKALSKTKNLSNYIQVICDKTSDMDEVNKALRGALDLFVNEDVWVEISSKNNSQLRRLKIRDYLNHLKLLNYKKIEIDWVNIQYVSQLHKANDDNYYGIVSFEQQFKGFNKNNTVYSDLTQKNVEVMLRSQPISNDGKTTSSYDILLSNIGVVETK